jgi:hypothetical protein
MLGGDGVSIEEGYRDLDVTKLYQCSCGFWYFVGNCGGVEVLGVCPGCGCGIGGEGYKIVEREGHRHVEYGSFMEEFEGLEMASGKKYLYGDAGCKNEGVGSEGFVLRYMESYSFNFLSL